MAYATAEELAGRLPPSILALAADDDADGAADDGVLESALEAGAAEIDGTLAPRYGVPVTPIPAVLREINLDLAAAVLLSRGRALPPDRRSRAEEARERLAAFAEGRAELPGVEPRPMGGSTMLETNRRFDREALEAY